MERKGRPTTDRSHLTLVSKPDVDFRIRMRPFEFEVAGQGSVAVSTSDIHLRFDEIPLTVTVPFLPRKVVAGSIGPFGVHIKPFDVQLRATGVDVRGVLGKEQVEAEVHAKGECKSEVDITGKLADEIVKAARKRAED
jgi:hypothetical protein